MTWRADLPVPPARFDRILVGSAIWAMGPLDGTVRRLRDLLDVEGALCFTIPSLYLGIPDEPGDGADPLLLRLPAEVFAHAPQAAAGPGEPLPGLSAMEALLAAHGFSAERFEFSVRLSQEALRDWLKIPALTEARLRGLDPDARALRIDEAFARVDADSWRREGWTGWTAWRRPR